MVDGKLGALFGMQTEEGSRQGTDILKRHKRERSREKEDDLFLRVGGPNRTTSRALMLSFCLSLWS